MRLLNPIDSAERWMSANVLERHTGTGTVYGCGPAVAGQALAGVFRGVQSGEYLGVVSLTLTEDIVQGPPSQLRGALGTIIGAGKPVFLADQQSIEWAPHLALANVRVAGTHVAWRATRDDALEALQGGQCLVQRFPDMDDAWRLIMRWNHPRKDELGSAAPITRFNRVASIDDVGVAIACAILEIPCLYYCTHPWGKTAGIEYNPLVRWAREHSVAENLCFDRETLERKVLTNDVVMVRPEMISLRAHQVEDMLNVLACPASGDPLAVLDVPKAPGKMLELGSVFDPSTHYCEEYYGGSEGLRYHLPNGEIRSYAATAHTWGGFKWVAKMLADLLPGRSLLDLGCGAGGFVREALAAGFDARGVDISEAAIRRANKGLEGRLFVQDITKPGWGQEADVVTALDLWEHIYAQDVPELMRAVHRTLSPGGIGFFVICTRGDGEQDWTITPGTKVTLENSWLLVSGHVTIRTWGWWAAMFEAHGFKIRRDLGHDFHVRRAEDPAMRGADSWSARNMMFVERV